MINVYLPFNILLFVRTQCIVLPINRRVRNINSFTARCYKSNFSLALTDHTLKNKRIRTDYTSFSRNATSVYKFYVHIAKDSHDTS